MFNLTRLGYVLLVAGCLGASVVYADIPVVEGVGSSPDASQQGNAVVSPDTSTQAGALPDADSNGNSGMSTSSYTPPPSNLTMPQRVSKLEHQMANQIDLMNQIQNLKQQVQDLQGKLDVAQHALEKLKQQQISMYQDLNSRIGGGTKTTASSATTTADSDSKDSATADLDNKATTKDKASDTASASSDVSSSDTTTNNANTASTTGDAKEQAVYQESYGFIKKGDYPKAISSLKKYVKLYPKGQYAANAHYWLGEIYYIQNDSKSAIAQFKDVIEQFPKDTKVADAKLKIGFVYFDNGQMQLSKKYLDEVVKDYPGSSAAKLADARLKQISKLS